MKREPLKRAESKAEALDRLYHAKRKAKQRVRNKMAKASRKANWGKRA